MLTKSKPEDAKKLWQQAQHDVDVRYRFYEYLAQRKSSKESAQTPASQPKPATKVADENAAAVGTTK
jgi:hypothetical protein